MKNDGYYPSTIGGYKPDIDRIINSSDLVLGKVGLPSPPVGGSGMSGLSTKCHQCNGTGRSGIETCSACKGSGQARSFDLLGGMDGMHYKG